MPDIFRGIHLNPLRAGQQLLPAVDDPRLPRRDAACSSSASDGWATSSAACACTRSASRSTRSRRSCSRSTGCTGAAGADWLIGFRLVQGVGAAFLIANSAAILTDAFPSHQRGLALGLNNVVGISGQFIGLIVGGLLAPINWRLIFLVSVPFGLFGTVWSYRKLREIGVRNRAPIDWIGNLTFALGLVLVMIGITYGIRPHGGNTMGWTSPFVLGCIGTGVVLLVVFAIFETRVPYPMFRLQLFRIRPYTFGVLSSFLSAIARGGLMFMMIIWLQGIWLPQHGYSFSATPLWAGIYMLPLTIGFLVAGPASGILSDRYGSRPFATGGMLGSALAFVLLDRLPVDFSYPALGGDPAPDGAFDGGVRVAQSCGRHEQPSCGASRCRRRDEPDLPELGAGPVDRHLLHADDHRPRRDPAGDPHGRARRRTACRPQPQRTSRTSPRSRCCSRRSSATTPCVS